MPRCQLNLYITFYFCLYCKSDFVCLYNNITNTNVKTDYVAFDHCNTMRFFKKNSSLILFILIMAFPVLRANDTIKHTINWLPPVPSWFSADSATGKVLLNFEYAKYSPEGVPFYSELYPLENNCINVNLELLSIDYDTIKDISSYSMKSNFPSALASSVQILKESKNSRLKFTLVPVIIQDNQFLIVKSFAFRVHKTISHSPKKSAPERWKNISVLNSGVWRKISISKTGVYKISYAEIKNLGFSNPEEIRVFGNGGSMLQERFTNQYQDDLNEIPVYLHKGSDGIFNDGDYILFYATGPLTWSYDAVSKKFVHNKHGFTGSISYFLTAGPNGLKIHDAIIPQTPESITISSYSDFDVHEENTFNLIKSGRLWVGEKFGIQTSRAFSFTFPDVVENSTMLVEGELLARSEISTSYSVRSGNQLLASPVMNRIFSDETSSFADIRSFISKTTIPGKDITLNILFDNKGDNRAEGWLNYIRVQARRKLRFSGETLLFRDTVALNLGKTAMYMVDNASSGLMLWEVTNLNNPRNIAFTLSGQQASFKSVTDTLREFVMFDPTRALSPEFFASADADVGNQNLHALSKVQMVIISHRNFLNQANELAELHKTKDNLSVVVVTPEQIYNEFSSGNPDPAAYRNFLKMLYDKASSPEEQPKYLLLFGDGSYKNYNETTDDSNSNFILTYQSVNSVRPVSSYVSDDYFGLLDDNESIESGLLDVGIGRLPVSNIQQAQAVVNKIKKYVSGESIGNWRNNLCFIADDEDGNIHMSQADQMTTFLKSAFPSYNQVKLYSDAFPQVTTSAGPRYPEMNKSIENTLNKGVLIVNYTGHGGKEGLAHEQIIKHEEIRNWSNIFHPLFITATCEFSRFDDYETTTAGEDVLLNEKGGGIALLSTTRLVYSGPNFVLNQEFYKNFGTKDSTGKWLRLGDLLRKTKNSSGTDINKLCFVLLGDPALKLNYPEFNVQTTEINGSNIFGTDTLKAYKEITIKGNITDHTGSPNPAFNGLIYPSVYDKELTVKTLNNDNEEFFTFKQQESLLYKGKASVKNGEFEFSFVVPREIAYNYGYGKISYYASGKNNEDAAGYFDKFIIGGISEENSL